MFKIVGRILLSLVLFISTTGLTVSKHYCGRHLISVNLFGDAKSFNGMDEGCCHQETDTYKITVDYTHPVFNPDFDQVKDVVPAQATICNFTLQAGYPNTVQFGPDPPPLPRQNLSSLQTYRL